MALFTKSLSTISDTETGQFFSLYAPSLKIQDAFQGTVAGFASGGIQAPGEVPYGPVNNIEKFPFAADSVVAADVGDLSANIGKLAGQSSATNGYTTGGGGQFGPPFTPPPYAINTINKFPFATTSSVATVPGSLTQKRHDLSGQSSSTNGYSSGGYMGGDAPTFPAPPFLSNRIDKFPFASDASATTVGSLISETPSNAGISSTTSGYSVSSSLINKFSFSTDANSSNAANLTVPSRSQMIGQSSLSNGYLSGGGGPSSVDRIDKFPFASESTQAQIGTLSAARSSAAGQSSTTYGYTSAGYTYPTFLTRYSTIDRFSFSSDGNATSIGSITFPRDFISGQQD